jgi:hypothetical protein
LPGGSRGLGDVYKRQQLAHPENWGFEASLFGDVGRI